MTTVVDNLEHISFVEGLLFYIAIRLGDKETLTEFLQAWGKEYEKRELEELGVRGDGVSS